MKMGSLICQWVLKLDTIGEREIFERYRHYRYAQQ